MWFCSKDVRFPEKLAKVITGNWYVDRKVGDTKILVFANKVMRYTIGDMAGKTAVREHCRSIGITEAQLDWPE